MRLRIRAVSIVALAAVGLPMTRLTSQSPYEVTFRAAAGPARGDGGRYSNRALNSFSVAMDIGEHHGGGSRPLVGFGYTYYRGSRDLTFSPVMCVRLDRSPCPPRATAFPDVKLGYVDLGWRQLMRDFNVDLRLQPTVAFMSRPDIVPLGLGGGLSVGHRVIGSFGIELGTSATYLPALNKARIGLRQLTLGLRTW